MYTIHIRVRHVVVATRAREIDKCQSVRQFSKRSAISGRTYGNSRLKVYVRIGVIGGNFGAYTFILPLPCFLNICLSFWMFIGGKNTLTKINID